MNDKISCRHNICYISLYVKIYFCFTLICVICYLFLREVTAAQEQFVRGLEQKKKNLPTDGAAAPFAESVMLKKKITIYIE